MFGGIRNKLEVSLPTFFSKKVGSFSKESKKNLYNIDNI